MVSCSLHVWGNKRWRLEWLKVGSENASDISLAASLTITTVISERLREIVFAYQQLFINAVKAVGHWQLVRCCVHCTPKGCQQNMNNVRLGSTYWPHIQLHNCKSHEEAWRVIMSPHLQEDRRVRRGIRHNCQHCKTAWHMHDIRITTCRSSHLRGGHHSHRAFSPPDSNGLYKSFSKLVSHDTAHWKDMINALNELMVHSVCMGLSLHSSSADDKSARFLSSAAFCKAFSTTDMALSYRAGSKACRI